MKTNDITPRTAKRLLPIPIIAGILLMILFATSSCDTETTMPLNKTSEKIAGSSIYEATYDGCQYIIEAAGSSTWGSHKGNCNNPIHKCPNQTVIHDTIYVIKQGDKFVPTGKCKQ